METLKLIDQECKKQLKIIYQMNMNDWVSLAKELGVSLDDRQSAAHKMAIKNLVSLNLL